MAKEIKSRIQQKHDIEANWKLAVNFIPKQGEIIIYDIDDNYDYERFKIGDGITKINDLPFALGDLHPSDFDNSSVESKNSSVEFKGYFIAAINFINKYIILVNERPSSDIIEVETGTANSSRFYQTDILFADEFANKTTFNLNLYGVPFFNIELTKESSVGNAWNFTDFPVTEEKMEQLRLSIDGKLAEGQVVEQANYIWNIEADKEDLINWGIMEGVSLPKSESFAFGHGSKALQSNSFAAGERNIAQGKNSAAFGINTVANKGAFAAGYGNIAEGDYSFTAGGQNIAKGTASAAIGNKTLADGNFSFAEGRSTGAYGHSAHTEGWMTTTGEGEVPDANPKENSDTTPGYFAHAEGNFTRAKGNSSHAEGRTSQAEGIASHAEGWNTVASGARSHSEGSGTKSQGFATHAEGHQTIASGQAAHAEGGRYVDSNKVEYYTTASGASSHAEGQATIASGEGSHAEGSVLITNNNVIRTEANKKGAHAEGLGTIASGEGAHAEGRNTQAINDASHAEGRETIASGIRAHAEGYATQATKQNTHAEGTSTKALGHSAHSEGHSTIAGPSDTAPIPLSENSIGYFSHAEGNGTWASGNSSHAEGKGTTASGLASHAGGIGTKATGQGQTVVGKYNAINDNALFIIGNGTTDKNRSNAFEVMQDKVLAHGKEVVTTSAISSADNGKILTVKDGAWSAETLEISQTTGDSTTAVMSQKALTDNFELLQMGISGKLPKSPSDWEPWTAEEQEAAQNRIGISGHYEMIEEIVLTDEVFEIIRDTDITGKQYSLQNLLLLVSAGTTTLKMILQIYINDDRIIDTESIGDTEYPFFYVCKFDINKGALYTFILGNRGDVRNRRSAFSSIEGMTAIFDKIKSLKIKILNPIKGATIKIYGVRV